MMNEYLKIAYRNIKHKKLRSSLTMIGIVISIATIFTLFSLSIGLNQAIQEQFSLFGTDKIFIMPKGMAGVGTGAVELTEADAKVVEKVSGVKEVSYYAGGSLKVEFNKKTRYVMGMGIPMDRSDLWLEGGLLKLQSGQIIKNGEIGKLILGYQYSQEKFFGKAIQVGDTLVINGKKFSVKGIWQSQGNPTDDQSITMSLDDYRILFPSSGTRVDAIVLKTNEGTDIAEVAAKIERKLRAYRDVTEKTQDFTIQTPEELLATFGTILQILTGFLIGIGAISLLVGGIGIANTMYTSVVERTSEIGVMKAVGARNSHILYIFMTEAGVLGAIGGAIGVLVGIGAGQIVEFIATAQLGTSLLQVATPLYLIVGSIVFAFLIGAVSGAIPSRHASKIRPVEALRYE